MAKSQSYDMAATIRAVLTPDPVGQGQDQNQRVCKASAGLQVGTC
jgi:hypothetical protein